MLYKTHLDTTVYKTINLFLSHPHVLLTLSTDGSCQDLPGPSLEEIQGFNKKTTYVHHADEHSARLSYYISVKGVLVVLQCPIYIGN